MEQQASRQHGEAIALDDGRFVFGITDADGQRAERSIDLLVLKLTCEEMESKHGLTADLQGKIRPTSQFLADLSRSLQADVPGCTPTIAWQLWLASFGAIERLKKNMSGTPK